MRIAPSGQECPLAWKAIASVSLLLFTRAAGKREPIARRWTPGRPMQERYLRKRAAAFFGAETETR
jgi:hypothetical protein